MLEKRKIFFYQFFVSLDHVILILNYFSFSFRYLRSRYLDYWCWCNLIIRSLRDLNVRRCGCWPSFRRYPWLRHYLCVFQKSFSILLFKLRMRKLWLRLVTAERVQFLGPARSAFVTPVSGRLDLDNTNG